MNVKNRGIRYRINRLVPININIVREGLPLILNCYNSSMKAFAKRSNSNSNEFTLSFTAAACI